MKKNDVLTKLKALRENTPEHLCYSCVVGYLMMLYDRTEDLLETTIDGNLCPMYLKTWSDPDILCVCDKESGNTRVHLDGFQTIDNGSGYHITGCPYRVEFPSGVTDEIVNLMGKMLEGYR